MSIFENKEVEKMQEYRMTQITKADIVPTALRMRHEGRWLVMIHGQVEPDGQVRVSYDYAVDPAVESYYVLGETTLPSICGHLRRRPRDGRSASCNELMGMEFEGLDTSKRLFLPEDMLETQGKGQILVTPLSELREKRVENMEKRERGRMSYIVPIGPYHPALEEPIHAKLYTEGEVIKDAEVFVGYNHRGIEKLATERNAIQTLVLVERVCGICSHSHALTYAMAVEGINGVEVPKRGQYIRVITAELERLHSHLLWARHRLPHHRPRQHVHAHLGRARAHHGYAGDLHRQPRELRHGHHRRRKARHLRRAPARHARQARQGRAPSWTG